MSNAWHVRGVDEQHRRMAKVAAAECGMTIGAWLTEVIAKVAPIGKHRFRIEFAEEPNGEEGPAGKGNADGSGVGGADEKGGV
jgi:hypothetical protein